MNRKRLPEPPDHFLFPFQVTRRWPFPTIEYVMGTYGQKRYDAIVLIHLVHAINQRGYRMLPFNAFLATLLDRSVRHVRRIIAKFRDTGVFDVTYINYHMFSETKQGVVPYTRRYIESPLLRPFETYQSMKPLVLRDRLINFLFDHPGLHGNYTRCPFKIMPDGRWIAYDIDTKELLEVKFPLFDGRIPLPDGTYEYL